MRFNASLLAFLACLSFSAAQEVGSFSEIVSSLERGIFLQINIDVEQCTAISDPFPTSNLFISMPMRLWSHQTTIDETSGQPVQVVNAEDFYLEAGSTAVDWVARNVQINEDRTVLLKIYVGGVVDPSSSFEFGCQLGSSAIVHYVDEVNAIDSYYTYLEVKSAMLLGRHVEAKAYLHRCISSDQVLPEGNEIVFGYIANNILIFNEGTTEEHLTVYENGVLRDESASNGLVSIGESLELWPNGSAIIQTGVFDSGTWAPISSSTYECILADSLQFSNVRRERAGTYVNYNDIKESTLQGHEMEVVIFKDYCQTVTGPIPAELTIGVRRFDTFQLFQADSTWGPLEHIAFSSYFTDATGLSYIEVVRVYEDDKVQVHYEIVDSPNGDWQTGELLCPLSTSAVFHASSRERRPAQSYADIVDRVMTEGSVFEVEVDLSGCEVPMDFGLTVGGVLWQSYISNAPDDQGFFYGVSSSIVSNPTVDGGLAWDVISFTLTPDDRVLVNFHLYDIPAGGDLLPDPSGALIECELHHGGGGGPGSVYFYRYP